jgi:hypothetical protein
MSSNLVSHEQGVDARFLLEDLDMVAVPRGQSSELVAL